MEFIPRNLTTKKNLRSLHTPFMKLRSRLTKRVSISSQKHKHLQNLIQKIKIQLLNLVGKYKADEMNTKVLSGLCANLTSQIVKSNTLTGGSNGKKLMYTIVVLVSLISTTFSSITDSISLIEERYVDYIDVANVPGPLLMRPLLLMFNRDEADKENKIRQMSDIIQEVNKMYVDAGSITNASFKMTTMCRDIFNDEDVQKILYKKVSTSRPRVESKEIDEWGEMVVTEPSSQVSMNDLIYSNMDLCTYSLPLPKLELDITSGEVTLQITKGRSYQEIMNVFDKLVDELQNEYGGGSAYIENQIGKLKYIQKHVYNMIHTFKTSETVHEKIVNISEYIKMYFSTFLKFEGRMVEIDKIVEFEREVTEARENHEILKLRGLLNHDSSNLISKRYLSFLTGPLFGLSDAVTDVGKNSAYGVAGVLNTFSITIIPSLMILCIMMIAIGNFMSRNKGHILDDKLILQLLRDKKVKDALLKVLHTEKFPPVENAKLKDIIDNKKLAMLTNRDDSEKIEKQPVIKVRKQRSDKGTKRNLKTDK